jgi:hypothetical protein
VRHLTLLAPAQDLIELLPGVEQTVKTFVASRELGKAAVVVGDEAGQNAFAASIVLVPAMHYHSLAN